MAASATPSAAPRIIAAAGTFWDTPSQLVSFSRLLLWSFSLMMLFALAIALA
jgi:hypothetical protein